MTQKEYIGKHSIKKFELIEKYVKSWAEKLINYEKCHTLAYIDCMSNSGLYKDESGNYVYGSPVRVAKILNNIAKSYPKKEINIYFNDIDRDKIDTLSKLLKEEITEDLSNIHCELYAKDANVFLQEFNNEFFKKKVLNLHTLLVYDPFDVGIDWDVLSPFFNTWSEVIINHMVSDTVRAAKQAKRDEIINKYEKTYGIPIKNIIEHGSDTAFFQKIVDSKVRELRLRKEQKYYIANFPFFNSKNSIVYNLMHCTSSIEGFKLYKNTAWKIFGGKSSTKKINDDGAIDIFSEQEDCQQTEHCDEKCYTIEDIADNIQQNYNGQRDVSWEDIKQWLSEHPVFPCGFLKEIKDILRLKYQTQFSGVKPIKVTFGKKKTL